MVAWLRLGPEKPVPAGPRGRPGELVLSPLDHDELADAIERGDHHKEHP
jgi:hypothetical protein